MTHRTESDSLGEVTVPGNALYGAQTQRAVQNFCGMQRPMPEAFLRALAQLKSSAAWANQRCGVLPDTIACAIQQAADEVAGGDHLAHFPVTVFQTGSGTSSNMNMNEVLAHLASLHGNCEIHPNDHVNCSQSSNDMVPSALQVSAALGIENAVLPALDELSRGLGRRADELMGIAKTGRTHLMDAMPLTLGQELGTWQAQLEDCRARFNDLQPRLRAIPAGGSAIGTGVNVPPEYPGLLVQQLQTLTGSEFSLATNRFSRMAAQDVALECSACLRSVAIALAKINNDLRWMASGPLAGLAEITLEPLQPGSSIMPGKVNPVLPEAVLMVAAEVVGNDATVAQAASSGNFQLNVMLPLIIDKLCTGIDLLAGACAATLRAIDGFTVDRDVLDRVLARNPILATALNTRVGYDTAATIAKRSYDEGRPVLEVAAELTDIPEDELKALLDPWRLTGLADDA